MTLINISIKIAMFLINRIKYNANKKYDKFEELLDHYENNNSNLTNYIFYAFLINDYNKKFTSIDLIIFKRYIKNLYISYYIFYIRDIICYGKEYIIKEEDIYDYINNNKSNYFINKRYFEKYILTYSNLNISIKQWLENIFVHIDLIPVFSYYNVTRYKLYIFVSKLLDYIITKNMNSIIIYIAKGYLS